LPVAVAEELVIHMEMVVVVEPADIFIELAFRLRHKVTLLRLVVADLGHWLMGQDRITAEVIMVLTQYSLA
jgi:hypothetical protein